MPPSRMLDAPPIRHAAIRCPPTRPDTRADARARGSRNRIRRHRRQTRRLERPGIPALGGSVGKPIIDVEHRPAVRRADAATPEHYRWPVVRFARGRSKAGFHRHNHVGQVARRVPHAGHVRGDLGDVVRDIGGRCCCRVRDEPTTGDPVKHRGCHVRQGDGQHDGNRYEIATAKNPRARLTRHSKSGMTGGWYAGGRLTLSYAEAAPTKPNVSDVSYSCQTDEL